jgi:hypothetical protein
VLEIISFLAFCLFAIYVLKSLQKLQNLSLATSKSWISITENLNFALNLNLNLRISGILSNLKQNSLHFELHPTFPKNLRQTQSKINFLSWTSKISDFGNIQIKLDSCQNC